jgi:hypothetical protein
MVRNAVLTLTVLAMAVVPVQAANTQGAGRNPVEGVAGGHPSNQHLGNPNMNMGNHRSGNQQSFNHQPFNRRPFNRRPFFPYGGTAFYAPPVSYGPGAYYDPAPVYDSPDVYSQPAATSISMAPPPAPMPSVIPYPTGRYELWGDGYTSPYQWVWIPNPPPAPPAAPQAPPAPSMPQPADPAASPQRSQLYRWVDDEAVVHFTQGLDSVPARYRGQLKLAGA